MAQNFGFGILPDVQVPSVRGRLQAPAATGSLYHRGSGSRPPVGRRVEVGPRRQVAGGEQVVRCPGSSHRSFDPDPQRTRDAASVLREFVVGRKSVAEF